MKTVMIVDDAVFMRLSLKDMLERHGFQVVGMAENGAAALEQYKSLKPDIVTMDITMPQMDGVTALKKIKEYDPKASIVMISALGLEERVKESIISGAKGFIVKPFKEDFVVQALSKL